MCTVPANTTMKLLMILCAFVVLGTQTQAQQQARRLAQQYQPQSVQSGEEEYQQRQTLQPRQEGPAEGRLRSTTFIPIIRFDKEQGSDGSYKAAWETGNNILAEEEGYLKNLGPDPDAEGEQLNAQVQQGSYSYTSPEGQIITVQYVADETGFHATGDHLPTPPPVSPEVQKGLDLIYAGIKARQEAADREARDNPQGVRKDNQIPQDYNGQYRQKK